MSKVWLTALLCVCACSSSKHDAGSGGASGTTAMPAGSGSRGSGGSGSGGSGTCIAEGADCRQTTTACCAGLLCSQYEQTCLITCTQAGECNAAFSQRRPGAKGSCCATAGYDPSAASITGFVCGARCMP